MDLRPGFGVYIHWPFCRSKCPYCDFNSQPLAMVGPAHQETYARALLAELDHALFVADAQHALAERVSSVFFGGGTPSLMSPATVEAVLDRLAAGPGLTQDCEVTLEANPGTINRSTLESLRALGVNRLSIGMQSLNDQSLRFLGRTHDRAQALEAYEMAKRLFERVSLDFIYALPGQSALTWQQELAAILALEPEHVSLYQLSIEAGTPFQASVDLGNFTPLDGDQAATLYEITQEMTGAAGLPAYEISNHARQGFACRHNLDIWRGGFYLGLGPGAHGRMERDGAAWATERLPDIADWTTQIARSGHGMSAETKLTPEERAAELLLLGLRLSEGIQLDRFRLMTGLDLIRAIDPKAYQGHLDSGALEMDGNILKIRDNKRIVLDMVLRDLLVG
jgi:putative oxygen-independent coproporphyrinogen III oxidase